VSYVVSDPPASWTGERGHIDAEVLRRGRRIIKCCNTSSVDPARRRVALEEALGDLGVPGDRVHTERFNFV
jgi:hypothetical protein